MENAGEWHGSVLMSSNEVVMFLNQWGVACNLRNASFITHLGVMWLMSCNRHTGIMQRKWDSAIRSSMVIKVVFAFCAVEKGRTRTLGCPLAIYRV